MADKPEPESLEELVTRRIREQLGSGTVEELLRAIEQRRTAVQADLAVVAGTTASAEVTHPPAEKMVDIIESASPELASDIRGRSPQDINFVINFYMAIMQTLSLLLMVYQIVHGEPPSHQQVIEIFNHTTNVYNHTTNVVVNMPPSHG